MSEVTAEETAPDVHGDAVLFCSFSCLDTWRHRPTVANVARGGV
jgi:hypothetical protein